ncbi:MAG: GGDEF domain-containing protein [Deltaproteobacteria bacterium]|nr:GGDEF domain-containing protein [Deltaproteobacteria bacterium]
MSPQKTRIQIENEILGRQEKKYSEEQQANHLMSLLTENYPLLSASVVAMEPEGKGVSVFAQRGLSGDFIKEMYTRKDLPLVAAALKGEIVVSGGEARANTPGFRLEHDCKSLYASPCRLQGETLGVLVADSPKQDFFTPEIRQDFRAYAQISALFLAMRTLRGKISRVPDVDMVTGLFTFKYFHEVLHRELTRGKKFRTPLSLMFLKIRNLREMNEVYGHTSADKALAEVAARIRASLRDVDYVSRSGGNIYVVMPGTTKVNAGATARKIADSMSAAPVAQGKIRLTLAIGVATYPKDGDTERVIIPVVESMVHESMRKGGNAVSVYKD